MANVGFIFCYENIFYQFVIKEHAAICNYIGLYYLMVKAQRIFNYFFKRVEVFKAPIQQKNDLIDYFK